MFKLPIALARAFVDANQRYHDKATTDADRNRIASDMLAAFREHDPNTSVWDMLALFDLAGDDKTLTTPPSAYFQPKRRAA